jgi:hypothetical protein
MQKLVSVLKKAGKPTRVYNTTDGTRVLVLPHGGRVLGLFSGHNSENFFWTHTALDETATAKEFYASNHWHNSGGDRTWLSPEVDLFFPHFPKLEYYFQQRALDPGRYRLVETKDGFSLVNRLTVKLSRSKCDLSLQITKRFGPAPNPLRRERELKINGVEYAGYTQYTSLELLGDSRRTRNQVGLWHLIQMPHGGDLLMPTFGRTEPRHIFSTEGTIPAEDLITNEHLVRYRMRQKGAHKISLRAVSIASRIGYLYKTGRQWALIIRNFSINPSGEYVDVPWKETDYFGFAVQACNVDNELGTFSELEYHTPAIGHGTRRLRCDDEAQVWAFRGPKLKIDLIAKALLTPTPWAGQP